MSKIKLNAASGGGSVSLEAPTSTTGNANVELKLPVADGSSSQVLTTNGSGQLNFATVSGTTINNNADNRVITGSGTANTLEAESGLTFDGTSFIVASGNSNIETTASSETPKIKFKGNNVTDAAKIEISESGGGGVFKIFTKPTSGPFVERIAIGTDGRVQHVSVDNTAFQLFVAGAVRLQIDHTGGGNIQISNPSTGNVTYSTSSDYRLKENATTINNALTTVKTLKPYQYTWKHDNKLGQGFFAHEAQAVLPDVGIVSGTKDAVHSEDNLDLGVKAGDPIYQGIDYSKLVPLLTAALQEEIAKREALEARIAALEG